MAIAGQGLWVRPILRITTGNPVSGTMTLTEMSGLFIFNYLVKKL